MGKQEYTWSDKVRFGELPKVERKVITKFSRVGGGFDHTSICTSEIAAMLRCFQTSQWSTAACTPEVRAMETCVEEHKGDPDPRLLARRWQSGLRGSLFTWFAKNKIVARLR